MVQIVWIRAGRLRLFFLVRPGGADMSNTRSALFSKPRQEIFVKTGTLGVHVAQKKFPPGKERYRAPCPAPHERRRAPPDSKGPVWILGAPRLWFGLCGFLGGCESKTKSAPPRNPHRPRVVIRSHLSPVSSAWTVDVRANAREWGSVPSSDLAGPSSAANQWKLLMPCNPSRVLCADRRCLCATSAFRNPRARVDATRTHSS